MFAQANKNIYGFYKGAYLENTPFKIFCNP